LLFAGEGLPGNVIFLGRNRKPVFLGGQACFIAMIGILKLAKTIRQA
jgi:hypothetical protein